MRRRAFRSATRRRGKPSRALRRLGTVLVCIALALHFVVVFSVASGERPVIWPLHNDTIHRPGPGADFFAVYHAAVNLSERESPYGFEDDGRTPYFFPYRYIPIVAQAGRLMLGLTPFTAYRLWVVFLEVILFVLIGLLWRKTRGWRRVFVACVLLLSSPYFLELYMGQFTFATTAFFALDLITASCVFYVLSVLLKMYPLGAGAAFIRTRRWKCFAIAVIALAAFTIPYFATHPNDLSTFRALNLGVPEGAGGGLHSGNYGFAYLLYLVIGALGRSADWPDFSSALHVAVLLFTAIAVFLSRERRLAIGATAMVLAHFVGYAQVWEHHYSGVLVLGILLLTQWKKRSGLTPLTVVSLVLLALPTPFAFFDTARDPNVWNPSADWSVGASLAVVLPKALPLIALYLASLVPVFGAGFRSPLAALRTLGADDPA
jgi:hypothetical protein